MAKSLFRCPNGQMLVFVIMALAAASCTGMRETTMQSGITLDINNGRPTLTSLPDIQTEMKKVGAGVWPLHLDKAPAHIKHLLGQADLTATEAATVRDYFLHSRERLLEVIANSGRSPNVPGGGELTTTVTNEGYSYPQLWLVKPGVDYTRFDRFHVNVSRDGTGVDEVMQVVSGKGVIVRIHSSGASIYTLTLATQSNRLGWMVSYDGGTPHIGSLSSAMPGTKVVMQVIGPRNFELHYTEDGGH